MHIQMQSGPALLNIYTLHDLQIQIGTRPAAIMVTLKIKLLE
jgi:hypothetical protein